jgi:NAD(P)-dependent dehydrogenase (short-subunit alcohol dehydrogenase family)
MTPDVESMLSLQGNVAIVTGGTSGIGRRAALTLARAGAAVTITSRDTARADETAAKIAKAAASDSSSVPTVVGLGCDVTDEQQVTDVVDAVADRLGGPQVLVTSAGSLARGTVEELDTAALRTCMETNFFGTWYAVRAATRRMTRQGYGRVITMGSVLSSIGAPARAGYAASKGAVAQLTKSLELELAGSGVTINCLLPGPTMTEMNESSRDDPIALRFISHEVPLGRWGETHELAGALLLLSSAASSFITGSMLAVDGGYLAH